MAACNEYTEGGVATVDQYDSLTGTIDCCQAGGGKNGKLDVSCREDNGSTKVWSGVVVESRREIR